MKKIITIMFIQFVFVFSTHGMEKSHHTVNKNTDIVIYQDLEMICQNFKKQILNISFYVQEKDCKLYDFSDPFGVCFLENQNMRITRPYLYPIMKNGKEGFLLGTCHLLPARFFMEKAMDCISSCKTLVRESEKTPITKKSLETCGLITRNVNYNNWWLHELSNPTKNYLLWILEYEYGNIKNQDITPLELTLFELTPLGAYEVYWAAHQTWGMEKQLEKSIGGEHYGLESLEESAPEMFDAIDAIELESRIQDDCLFGSPIKNAFISGFFEDYCDGSFFDDDDDDDDYWDSEFDIKSGTAQRNYMWLPKFDKHFEELERPLFAVGVMHLPGPHGLLSLLKKNGYTIGDPSAYWED